MALSPSENLSGLASPAWRDDSLKVADTQKHSLPERPRKAMGGPTPWVKTQFSLQLNCLLQRPTVWALVKVDW